MSGATPHVFLVAGEESGDRLGGPLIAALRRATGGNIRISGVGGAQMAAEGVPSLFPLGDLAIVGFVAIAMSLPKILGRIRQTADAVIAARPDVLVIIDSPEFTHRVARRVRARAPEIRIIDYVCPSVWAWRPGRAPVMRAYIDRVLALLPFEPAAMARLNGPPTDFVGHPLSEQLSVLRPDAADAKRRLSDPPLLLVLPGSRRGEIRRMAKMFGDTLALVAARVGALEVVIPAVPRLEAAVREAVSGWAVVPRIVTNPQAKQSAFRQARAALTKSGTSTLELALAGVPMVGAYLVSFVEAVVGSLLIKAPSAILANLVVGENVVPEFLQWHCSPEKLAEALVPLLSNTPERRRQIEAFGRIDAIMDVGGPAPSDRAAALILRAVRPI
jgi:lipid-A-disaccharide synthase